MDVVIMEGQSIKNYRGLTTSEAGKLQEQFGRNELVPEKKESFLHKVVSVISEPMFILLIVAESS